MNYVADRPFAAYNTRDLGGLTCAGGTVRPGRIWRGALHSDRLPGGLPTGTGLPHVFDLRLDREVPDGIGWPGRWHRWPLHDPEWTRGSARDERYFIDSALRLLPAAGPCLAEVMGELAAGESVFIGCRLGKDRTGLVVLLLGLLLEVHRDELIADYLQTAASFRAAADWVAGYARQREEDPAAVLARLSPSELVPRGILAALPDGADELCARLGIAPELAHRARWSVVEGRPSRSTALT